MSQRDKQDTWTGVRLGEEQLRRFKERLIVIRHEGESYILPDKEYKKWRLTKQK